MFTCSFCVVLTSNIVRWVRGIRFPSCILLWDVIVVVLDWTATY
jgi:hypothetical protein